MELIFSPEAREDMENIYRYFAEYNEPYAIKLYNEMIEEAETLQHFPRMAQREFLLEEYSEEYRSLVVHRRYKIVYFIENDAVNVATVFDCRQDPQKLKDNIRDTRI